MGNAHNEGDEMSVFKTVPIIPGTACIPLERAVLCVECLDGEAAVVEAVNGHCPICGSRGLGNLKNMLDHRQEMLMPRILVGRRYRP